MRGLTVSKNAMGFASVRLHYTADPTKDPGSPDPSQSVRAEEWLNVQRRLFPDPVDFERELEINFHVGKGARVFPQFSEALHGKPLTPNERKVFYRAWDFGWHCPACIVAQVDPQGRLLVLRELLRKEQTTRAFGTWVLERLAHVYPRATGGYDDYSDPAGRHRYPIESEKGEQRDIEVLNSLGVFPKVAFGWSRKDGRALIHQLLQPRADGTPGIYVDPAGCPMLTRAFLGAYTYIEQRDGKISEEPDDKTHPWADLMAALRYLVIGLAPKLGLGAHRRWDVPMEPSPPVSWHGYGTPRHARATR